MGGVCCGESVLHKNVSHLANEVPAGKQYQMRESPSIRFSDVSVSREERVQKNQYRFVMSVLNSDASSDQVSISIIILNEKMHCLLSDNYQLKISKRMIIDIFCKSLSSTLIEAKNERTGVDLSLQIIAFRGYTSETFKKSLYHLHVLNKVSQIKNFQLYYHRCIDYFVYGCNPDRQALAIMYERAETSLANVAEFRKLAEWPWTPQEKLKIFIDLMDSVYYLHKRKICHRDIRPGNILFVERLGRYVLSDFSKTIEINEDFESLSNRTVYGIEYMFKKSQKADVKKISDHLRQEKQYASYVPRNMDYHGLEWVLRVLESNDILEPEPKFEDKLMIEVQKEFSLIYESSFTEVREKLHRLGSKHGIEHVKLNEDEQICFRVSKLASQTHKELIEDFLFQSYDILGYEKQFSDSTHYLIQKNNENNKSLENAYLLKNLGEFFERNGAKGTEYYCNACLLFLKRTQRNLNHQNLQQAQEDYYQAEKCYIKFSQNFESHSTYIQLHRLKAMVSFEERNIERALSAIRQIFKYAASKKITIEKQMTLLLSFAKIEKRGSEKEREMAEQKLKNGLAICQNVGAFESVSSCRIHTSNFLYEMGTLYLSRIREFMHSKEVRVNKVEMQSVIKSMLQISDPEHANKAEQLQKLKALAESNLSSCLQIRQKEPIETIFVADTLQAIGELYFIVHSYSEAKRTLSRCEIVLKQIESEINPIVMIRTLYTEGSVLYQLKQFNEAEYKYSKALGLFSKLDGETYELLRFNIQGNKGLSQLQLNKADGDKNVREAKNQIKRLKGENFYDYLVLNFKHKQLNSKSERRRKFL